MESQDIMDQEKQSYLNVSAACWLRIRGRY